MLQQFSVKTLRMVHSEKEKKEKKRIIQVGNLTNTIWNIFSNLTA